MRQRFLTAPTTFPEEATCCDKNSLATCCLHTTGPHRDSAPELSVTLGGTVVCHAREIAISPGFGSCVSRDLARSLPHQPHSHPMQDHCSLSSLYPLPHPLPLPPCPLLVWDRVCPSSEGRARRAPPDLSPLPSHMPSASTPSACPTPPLLRLDLLPPPLSCRLTTCETAGLTPRGADLQAVQ